MPQDIGDRGARWSGVLVSDPHCRHAGRSAHEIAEQAKDDDRRDKEKRQRPAVAPESLQQPTGDRPDAVAAHDSFRPASARKASSRFCDPPWTRMSAGDPSARRRPYWIKPSRWHRSASSITWLETMSVVPAAAMRRKYSQNWTRSCGSMPTVGSSRRSSSGRCTSAHASEHRWRMPPLSVATTDLRRSYSCTSSSAALTPFSAPLLDAKKATFSSTESAG